MLLGLLAGVLAAWLIGDFSEVFAAPSEMLGVVLAAVAICAVGVLDDRAADDAWRPWGGGHGSSLRSGGRVSRRR